MPLRLAFTMQYYDQLFDDLLDEQNESPTKAPMHAGGLAGGQQVVYCALFCVGVPGHPAASLRGPWSHCGIPQGSLVTLPHPSGATGILAPSPSSPATKLFVLIKFCPVGAGCPWARRRPGGRLPPAPGSGFLFWGPGRGYIHRQYKFVQKLNVVKIHI